MSLLVTSNSLDITLYVIKKDYSIQCLGTAWGVPLNLTSWQETRTPDSWFSFLPMRPADQVNRALYPGLPSRAWGLPMDCYRVSPPGRSHAPQITDFLFHQRDQVNEVLYPGLPSNAWGLPGDWQRASPPGRSHTPQIPGLLFHQQGQKTRTR